MSNDQPEQRHTSAVSHANDISRESTLPEPATTQREGKNFAGQLTLKEYLFQNVDPLQSTSPLAAFCFMTGFMYDIFSQRVISVLTS